MQCAERRVHCGVHLVAEKDDNERIRPASEQPWCHDRAHGGGGGGLEGQGGKCEIRLGGVRLGGVRLGGVRLGGARLAWIGRC